jgi:MFS transporter, AAHS family, 4-hydroxybenzoate transporter
VNTRQVNFHDLIDSSGIGKRQLLILAFCSLLMLIDGFDTQVISFIVPVLAKEWQLPKAVLGSIFSAAFFGLLIGNFGVPFVSRRIGTKKMAIIATGAFGLFTLLAAFVSSVPQLIALRVLTGIGLGAATPCAVSLVSEFSPKRTRATFVTLIYIGYSLGFVLAGFFSGGLIPRFGWQSPLWLGGISALVIMVLLTPFLPESATYLVQRRRNAKLITAAQRLFPSYALPVGAEFSAHADKASDTSVKGLFARHLRLGTFLLWIVFIINLAAFYFLQSWLPTVLSSIAFPPSLVIWSTAIMIIGGMVSILAMGPIMDRVSAYQMLAVLYVVGAVSMYGISLAISAPHWVLLATIFLCGFCISGGQTCAIALNALFYPPGLRGAGVAWAYGFGRLGAAGGTYLAGVLYASNWTPASMFRVSAAPVLIAAFCVAWMGWRYATAGNSHAAMVHGDA